MHWWAIEIYQRGGAWLLASWCFWVIASVVLHELAHGWAAIRAGDRTPIETGHMTWNPVVHMGNSGVLMFLLIGVTWGFMPINPARMRGRYDHAKVAFAGPMTNIVLGLLCVVGAVVMDLLHARGVIEVMPGTTAGGIRAFFVLGSWLNFVLAPLNLLPIPPLDGSRILANFSAEYRRFIDNPQAAGVSMVLLLMIFLFGGSFFFGIAMLASNFLIDTLGRAVGA